MTSTEIYEAYIAAENGRDRAGMKRCLHPDLEVSINGVAQLADRDADAEATDRLLALYPDYRRHIRRILHVGQTVVAEWEMIGEGRPAEGVSDLSAAGCTIAEVADGVIVRAHLYTDPSVLDRVLGPSATIADS